MLVQEVNTDVPPLEVFDRAREFFTTRFNAYASFEEDESDAHIRFVSEAGELTIGALVQDGLTVVRGSTSRMNHELSLFFLTLAAPEEIRQNLPGPGTTGAG